MKNTSVLAFLLTLNVSYSVLAQNISVVPKEDIFFKTVEGIEQAFDKQNQLFSGAVVLPDDEGREITYIYHDGLRHGVAVSRYEDGKMELETTYGKGVKNGEEIAFYPNGNPKYKKTYKDNVLNGEEIFFYENGKPQQQKQYVNGRLHGTVTYYDNNGNRTRIENYKNGLKDGIEHIIENNILKEEHNYVDGKLNGISKKFNEQYLIEETEYKDDKKEGLSKQYLLDGSVVEIPYVNGKKNGTGFAFYPDKKTANKAVYMNDKKNGVSEKYYKNGQLQVSENYKDDMLEGISRKYNDKGVLEKVSYYVKGTELSTVDVSKNTELNDIYTAYRSGQLGKYMSKKNLWYPILWLGLNLNNTDILDSLAKEMKMYVSAMDDTEAYKRESKSKYSTYNRDLFFGLTPLSYAVNLSSPVEILQRFATESKTIEELNPRGTTALLEAIHLNNLEMVKYLLLRKADVKKQFDGKNTALLYAVKENAQLPIIRELVIAGADINALDNEADNALMYAIRNNNAELVELLAEYNVDMNGISPDGKTMLFYAFSHKADQRIIDRMFDVGADVNKKDAAGDILLIQSLRAGDNNMSEKLLSSGADVNLTNADKESAASYVLFNKVDDTVAREIFNQNIDVKTPHPKYRKQLWQLAMEQGRLDLLELVFNKMESITEGNPAPLALILDKHDNEDLIDLSLQYVSAADLNKHPEFIRQAVMLKDIGLWQKLVAKDFDVNTVKIDSEPLLLYLIKNDYPLPYIETMENDKLNINIVNEQAEDALWLAIQKDNVPLADNLLHNGANMNNRRNGRPYLMWLKGEQADLTNLFIQNGADVNLMADDKTTMLMAAVANLNETLITHLLSEEVDLAVRDADGNNALLYLADSAKVNNKMPEETFVSKVYKIAKQLQDSGIDINSQNGDGETLLIRMARMENPYYVPLAERLSELGLNSDLKNQYGKTAADYLKARLLSENKN